MMFVQGIKHDFAESFPLMICSSILLGKVIDAIDWTEHLKHDIYSNLSFYNQFNYFEVWSREVNHIA